MTTNAYVFRITLAMPGCFLVSAGACANEYFSERIRRPFREQTDDCVCTVLAAPHAYLAEYCPFERSFSNLPAGQWSPPSLVAFAFRELGACRSYELFLFRGRRVLGESGNLFSTHLASLAPDKYTVTLTNIGEPHDALTPMPLRATLGNRVIETHYELPQRAKEQIRELHSLIEELREATRTRTPADAWELVTGNNGHYASVQQLPVATVEEIIKSTNAAEALTAITTPLRYPADAPLFLEKIFPEVLRTLGSNGLAPQLLRTPPNDDDPLHLSDEEMQQGYRIGDLYFALQAATPEQLHHAAAIVKARIACPVEGEDLRKCLAEHVLTTLRDDKKTLTALEQLLFNS